MRFLNERTGAVIDVPCRLEGPDWKELTEAKQDAQEEKAPTKAAPKKKTVKKG
jgi:hypothetical protein